MARDDFFVIAYRILAYLYGCMKAGEKPDPAMISAERLGVPAGYRSSVLKNLLRKGYVEGMDEVEVPGFGTLIDPVEPEITMDGVEFMQENSAIARAKAALKELKEIVPGL